MGRITLDKVVKRFGDVEVIRRGDVSRAKLYYLRDRQGKDARVREKLRGAK